MNPRHGWSSATIDDVFATISAGRSVEGLDRAAGEDEWGVLTLSAVADGQFDPTANKCVREEDRAKLTRTVTAGTILLSRSNTEELVGSCVIVDRDYPQLATPDLLWTCVVRPNIDPAWAVAYMRSGMFRCALRKRLTGTSSSMKKLSMAAFRKIPLLLPPISEQHAIGDLARHWARYDRLQRDLLSRKKARRDMVREALLNGQLLLPNIGAGDWTSVTLREVTRESKRTNAGSLNRASVMGVSKITGMTPMRERAIAANVARYKIVLPDGFAYNPMRINVGSIARWTGDGPVLVSPDYVVFDTVPGVLDPRYLDHYRRTRKWQSFVESAGQGSVRVRIYYDDLSALSIRLPSLVGQCAIADLLDVMDRDIALHERQILLRNAQKRAVLDQLLSGSTTTVDQRETAV